MDEKTLNNLLNEFPLLWAIRSHWSINIYANIVVKRAELSDFITVINECYDVQVWLKISFGIDGIQRVKKLKIKKEHTIAQLIKKEIPSNGPNIDYVVIEESRPTFNQQTEKILIIHKKPKKGQINDIFNL